MLFAHGQTKGPESAKTHSQKCERTTYKILESFVITFENFCEKMD